jgi:tetratricopeptide (TPR) repeat protein
MRPWIALLLALAAAPAGATPEARFDEGYAAYEADRFAEAAESFRAAIEEGVRDPRLEYNLANAEFRSGRIGVAILHWERALRLAPGDPDVLANLALARERLVDRIEVPDPGPFARALARAQGRLGPDLQAVVVLILFLASAFVLAWCLRRPGGFGPAWGWMLSGLALALVLAGWSFAATLDRVEGGEGAIVLEPAVEVLAGPSPANATVFRMHEGTRVELRESRGGWVRVSLPNGLTGWVPADAVERI